MVHLLMTLVLGLICSFEAAAAPGDLVVYFNPDGKSPEFFDLVSRLQKGGFSRHLRFSNTSEGSDYELKFTTTEKKQENIMGNDGATYYGSASLVPTDKTLSQIIATGEAPSIAGATEDVVANFKGQIRKILISLQKGKRLILEFDFSGSLPDPQEFCKGQDGRLAYAEELVQERISLDIHKHYYVANSKYQDRPHYLVQRNPSTYEVKWDDGGEAHATVIYCMSNESGPAPPKVLCTQEIYRLCRSHFGSDQTAIEENCGLLIAKADAYGSKRLKEKHEESIIDESTFHELGKRMQKSKMNLDSLKNICSHLIKSKDVETAPLRPGQR